MEYDLVDLGRRLRLAAKNLNAARNRLRARCSDLAGTFLESPTWKTKDLFTYVDLAKGAFQDESRNAR